MPARPFPFASLPAWHRTDVALTRGLLRRLAPVSPVDRAVLEPLWAAVLGAVPRAHPLPPRVSTPADIRHRYEGATLAAVLYHPSQGPMAALADRGPALTLAARALGLAPERACTLAAEGALTPALEGPLALLLAHAATILWAPSPPPMVRAITESVATALEALGSPVALTAMEVPSDRLLVWPWRYTAGAIGGEFTLVIPMTAIAAGVTPSPAVCDRTGNVGVPFTLVAGRAWMEASAVATLVVGDVLTLDGVTATAGAVTGPVDIALGVAFTVGVTGWIDRDNAVRLTGTATPWRRHLVESDGERDDRAVRTDILGAIGVEVVVEIAHGSVTVSELAAWRVGEVVTLGQRLGETVTVRAGGRVVARGDLVDVDGEVGVRLTELL